MAVTSILPCQSAVSVEGWMDFVFLVDSFRMLKQIWRDLDGIHNNINNMRKSGSNKHPAPTSPDFHRQNHEIIDPYLLSRFRQKEDLFVTNIDIDTIQSWKLAV